MKNCCCRKSEKGTGTTRKLKSEGENCVLAFVIFSNRYSDSLVVVVAAVETLVVTFSVPSMKVIAMEIMEVMVMVEVDIVTREGAMVAVARIEVVVHRAVETGPAVVPGTRADEDTAVKPVRTVIPVRRAVVRRIAVIPIRTRRGGTDVDAKRNLSRRLHGSGKGKGRCGCRRNKSSTY